MAKLQKLPDAEFEVMKVVWANEPPITTNLIMEQLGNTKGWKVQTVVTLLLRLVERGYLSKERRGREGLYFPLISRDEYLQFETDNFVKQYHDNSFLALVNTLFKDKNLTDKDISEIDKLLQKARERRS